MFVLTVVASCRYDLPDGTRWCTDGELRAQRLEEGKELQPFEAVGMSNEEILDVFYDKISYKAAKGAWQTALDAERLRGQKLTHDLFDAKSGDVVAEAEPSLRRGCCARWKKPASRDILVSNEELLGSIWAKISSMRQRANSVRSRR